MPRPIGARIRLRGRLDPAPSSGASRTRGTQGRISTDLPEKEHAMKSLFRPALAAAALTLVLAPPSAAENPAQGQLVIDGTTSLGPMHGQAHGAWTPPANGEGELFAKLYDAQGVERFTLSAALTEYLFFVAAPAQGEIHGLLLVAPQTSKNGTSTVSTQIYASVEGMWIETPAGYGSFHASILPFGAPDEVLAPIGEIQGKFKLARTPGGRIQPALAEESNAGAAAPGGGGTAMQHVSLAPQPIVCYPDPARTATLDPVLVPERERAQRRLLNDHGGLGHVNGDTAGPGSTPSATAAPTPLGRATMRWQLFE
jgi:hypothetical protein